MKENFKGGFLVYYWLLVHNQKDKNKHVFRHRLEHPSMDRNQYGWSDFISLDTLYDEGWCYTYDQSIVLDAELYMFKGFKELSPSNGAYKWRLNNFLALKEIRET